jgi:hypothetical protein
MSLRGDDVVLEVALNKEIICSKCSKNYTGHDSGHYDIEERYDCLLQSEQCICMKLHFGKCDSPALVCKCCRVCAHLKTLRITDAVYKDSYYTPPNTVPDKCARCLNEVYHNYFFSSKYMKSLLEPRRTLGDNNDVESSDDENDSTISILKRMAAKEKRLGRSGSNDSIASSLSVTSDCSVSDFITPVPDDVYVAYKCTSINVLHKKVLAALESQLRMRSADYVNSVCDARVLELGRELTTPEHHSIWHNFIQTYT